MKQLTFIDMFAGIGGFHSGMEQAGHKCVGWIEWDKYARQSYQAIYDTEEIYNAKDIQDVRGRDLPDANVWCFGSPCTNISLAGNRKGLGGEQSRMFFEVIRLLKERTEHQEKVPEYLIMENVKNLLSSNDGRDFARVQIEMEQAGYDVEWNVFNSAEVVPQNRERVYIIGHLRTASTRKVFPIIGQNGTVTGKPEIKIIANASKTKHHSDDVMDESGISKTITAQNAYKHTPKVAVHQVGQLRRTASFGGNPQTGRVYGIDGVAPTLNTMQGGGREPKILLKKVSAKENFGRLGKQAVEKFNDNRDEIEPGDVIEPYNHRVHKDGKTPTVTTRPEGLKTAILPVTENLRIRKLTPLECWRLQGFKDEQFYKAKDAGVSNSQLYKQAGNAVTVPVVKAIAERMELKDD